MSDNLISITSNEDKIKDLKRRTEATLSELCNLMDEARELQLQIQFDGFTQMPFNYRVVNLRLVRTIVY